MIRRSTWIVLIVLVALVGFSFYLTNQKSKDAARPTPTEGSAPLFPATEGSATDIKIVSTAGNQVEIAADQSGTWSVKSPVAMAADPAGAEAAATQVSSLRVLSTIALGLPDVGLDSPADTMTVTFGSGKSHKLLIGSSTPIQNGYYCQLDGGAVIVVDKPGLDALLGLLTSPPYIATLTAAPSATPAAALSTPTVASTESPAATASTAPAATAETPSGSSATATP